MNKEELETFNDICYIYCDDYVGRENEPIYIKAGQLRQHLEETLRTLEDCIDSGYVKQEGFMDDFNDKTAAKELVKQIYELKDLLNSNQSKNEKPNQQS